VQQQRQTVPVLDHRMTVAVCVHTQMVPVFAHMMVAPELSHRDVLLLWCRMMEWTQMHTMVASVQIRRWMQIVPMHMEPVLSDWIHRNQHCSHEPQ